MASLNTGRDCEYRARVLAWKLLARHAGARPRGFVSGVDACRCERVARHACDALPHTLPWLALPWLLAHFRFRHRIGRQWILPRVWSLLDDANAWHVQQGHKDVRACQGKKVSVVRQHAHNNNAAKADARALTRTVSPSGNA